MSEQQDADHVVLSGSDDGVFYVDRALDYLGEILSPLVAALNALTAAIEREKQ